MSEVEFSDTFIVMVTGAVNGISCSSTTRPDVKYHHLDPRAVNITEGHCVVDTVFAYT